MSPSDPDPYEIRALRAQLESKLNILPRHLREANVRREAKDLDSIDPILSSAEVEYALAMFSGARWIGNRGSGSRGGGSRERAVIVIDSINDDPGDENEDEVVATALLDGDAGGHRGKRIKLEEESKAVGVLEESSDEESERADDQDEALKNEGDLLVIEWNAEDADASEQSDDKDSEGDSSPYENSDDSDSPEEDVYRENTLDKHPPPASKLGSSSPIPGPTSVSEDVDKYIKEEERDTKYHAIIQKALGPIRKPNSRVIIPRAPTPKRGRSKRNLSMKTLEERAAKYEEAKKRKKPRKVSARRKKWQDVGKQNGCLGKVALRKQKKLDRGEEIPDALEFIPGTKAFEDASASFGGTGQFGDDFLSFGNLNMARPVKQKKQYSLAKVGKATYDDPVFMGFGDVEVDEPEKGATAIKREADFDDHVAKVENGDRRKKKRRHA